MTGSNIKHLIRLLRRAYPAPQAIYAANGLQWRSRVELRLIRASAFIRESSEWFGIWQQSGEPLEHWAAQIAEQFGLTDRDVDYVLAELGYYASLQASAAPGTTHSSVDMVWTSNEISNADEIAENLKQHSMTLEDELRQVKPWTNHYLPCAYTDGAVRTITLLDPSLYSLMYNTSQVLSQPILSPEAALELETRGIAPGSSEQWIETITAINDALDELSEDKDRRRPDRDILVPACCDSEQVPKPEHGSWLPTEFAIDSAGKACAMSYINNLHPARHAAMYIDISHVFTRFVPLLEQVLTDMAHQRGLRVPVDIANCVAFDSPHPEEMEYGLRQFFLPIETSVTWDEWAEGIEYTEPQPQPFAMPRRPLTPYSLQNTRIQAAVKIVSIEIPGGCTEYTERVWQVAGGDDERILATGIYFFDVENIANIEMQFRESVKHNIDCSGNKKEAMRLVYGDGQRNNTHGKYVYPNVHQSVNITNSKLVCFPNVYHYRISSVKRKDAAVSGHAKLLVFYFVDPSVRVLSTEMVPPQQQSWWAESVFATPPLRSLPYEIAEHILSYVTLPIPLKDACARRDIIEAKYTSAITQ